MVGCSRGNAITPSNSSHSCCLLALIYSPQALPGLSGTAPASHLAGGLSATEDAEVDHQPGQCQAERLLPLHVPTGLQRWRDVQGLPVPEVLGGRRLLALLLIAGAVAVQGAGGPRQGVLGGRDMGRTPAVSTVGRARVPVGDRGDEGKEGGFLPWGLLVSTLCCWGLGMTLSPGNDLF